MTDKNLFLYDLAMVAIFKDEGNYLKEWLDYHLLAGVEHTTPALIITRKFSRLTSKIIW